MVTFRLIHQKEKNIIYWYFPEGNEVAGHGVITVDLESETIKVTEMAPNDFFREIRPDELNYMRDDINQLRKESGKPELTEEELPIATEPIIRYTYGNHAINRISEVINNGKILEKGTVMWY